MKKIITTTAMLTLSSMVFANGASILDDIVKEKLVRGEKSDRASFVPSGEKSGLVSAPVPGVYTNQKAKKLADKQFTASQAAWINAGAAAVQGGAIRHYLKNMSGALTWAKMTTRSLHGIDGTLATITKEDVQRITRDLSNLKGTDWGYRYFGGGLVSIKFDEKAYLRHISDDLSASHLSGNNKLADVLNEGYTNKDGGRVNPYGKTEQSINLAHQNEGIDRARAIGDISHSYTSNVVTDVQSTRETAHVNSRDVGFVKGLEKKLMKYVEAGVPVEKITLRTARSRALGIIGGPGVIAVEVYLAASTVANTLGAAYYTASNMSGGEYEYMSQRCGSDYVEKYSDSGDVVSASYTDCETNAVLNKIMASEIISYRFIIDESQRIIE
ncbi:MAG: hypothetical protein HON90_11830 [Halobacteriovoraceae bacterium]|jgi:hypothetical protein|nr:hypothetical protein [Halobacteriovoraceae bacterium]